MLINFRAGNWVHVPPGELMSGLQEFTDPGILCECTCVCSRVHSIPQVSEGLITPKMYSPKHPTLCARFSFLKKKFFFLNTDFSQITTSRGLLDITVEWPL